MCPNTGSELSVFLSFILRAVLQIICVSQIDLEIDGVCSPLFRPRKMALQLVTLDHRTAG